MSRVASSLRLKRKSNVLAGADGGLARYPHQGLSPSSTTGDRTTTPPRCETPQIDNKWGLASVPRVSFPRGLMARLAGQKPQTNYIVSTEVKPDLSSSSPKESSDCNSQGTTDDVCSTQKQAAAATGRPDRNPPETGLFQASRADSGSEETLLAEERQDCHKDCLTPKFGRPPAAGQIRLFSSQQMAADLLSRILNRTIDEPQKLSASEYRQIVSISSAQPAPPKSILKVKVPGVIQPKPSDRSALSALSADLARAPVAESPKRVTFSPNKLVRIFRK